MREAVIVSWTDGQILDHIQRLAWEAHGLYAKSSLGAADRERLRTIRIELETRNVRILASCDGSCSSACC
jgi:hypothetical protein